MKFMGVNKVEEKQLITFKEAGVLLGVGYQTVRRLVLDGAIPFVMIRQKRKVKRADVLAYIDRQTGAVAQ